MADVNRRGFFGALLAVVAAPLALVPWWMRPGTRPHTTSQLFEAGDVFVMRASYVVHPDAFAMVMDPLTDREIVERCHVCGSKAELTSGGMWHCSKCEHAWLSGFGVIKGESS